MRDHLKSLLQSIPQHPQIQDSLNDQLAVLVAFANRLGLYDAADHINHRFADRT